MLKLYNTLTRKKENFKSLKKNVVGIYTCGPTVYNYVHIGNHRSNILSDLLKRSFEFLGYKVNHVMNITDVDDKTIRDSQKEKKSLKEFTRNYEKIFFEELVSLNIQKPKNILRATENFSEMITLIQDLLKKKYAYKTKDGVYFDISKSKNYGKLAQLQKIKKTKSRIANDEYDKQNAQDFSLWKFPTKEDGENFWDSPFGKGRPGWHIECSAMSMKVLGKTFDAHTGGSDLIFPHHTNEIAQSEGVTGKKFVNYWVHGGMLTMKEKMSKSLGNTFYLKELEKEGFSPMIFRYFTLTSHYRKPLNFSMNNLEAAKNSYDRLRNILSTLEDDKKTNKEYLKMFEGKINDDLNMPEALQVLWNLVRDEKAKGKFQTIKKMDEVFGLKLLEKEKFSIPSAIKKLAEEREKARKEKDWRKSDELRGKINKLGYFIEDKERGYVLKKNNGCTI